MTHAIQAEGLVKRFGATTALAGIDLEVPAATVMGLLGPNGSGKTTAVRILATLLRADAGRALIGGYDVQGQAHQVRQLIGLTGQDATVDEELHGAENLYLIGRLVGLGGRDAKRRGADLLERFDLTTAARRPVKTYSGGMRRRLDLAASLMIRPQILFLDEPTTGLDPMARSAVWDTVRELVAEGVTVLLTTQYLDEADHLANRITVMDRGTVIASGTTDQLKERIGGQVLEVQPLDPAKLEAAAAIVERLAEAAPAIDAVSRMVTVPLSDPGLLAEAVRRLDQAGIVAAELALRRPSLDEVFLTLTGHRAEPVSPRPRNRERGGEEVAV